MPYYWTPYPYPHYYWAQYGPQYAPVAPYSAPQGSLPRSGNPFLEPAGFLRHAGCPL